MEECRERIRDFLSQYVVRTDGGELPADEMYFMDGIEMLLKEHVFADKEELKAECLREFDVVIPDFLFIED